MAAPTGGPKGVECWPRDTVLWVSTCHVKYLSDVLCVHFMRRSHFCWMVSLPMFFHTCPRKGFYEARTWANTTEQSEARGFSALIHTIYRLYWVFNCMTVCIYYLTFAVSFVLQITYKSRLFLFLFCLQLCKTTCCHGCGLQGEEQAAGGVYWILPSFHIPHSCLRRPSTVLLWLLFVLGYWNALHVILSVVFINHHINTKCPLIIPCFKQ